MRDNMPEPDAPRIQSYSKLAHDYDDKRFVGDFNALTEGFRRQALSELLVPGSALALDVACGTGRGVMVLQESARRAVGVDGTFEMLAVAQGKIREAGRRALLGRANAGALPFRDATFDLITCLNFVHLFTLAEKRAFVREIGRVLKPGGTAVVEFDNQALGVVLGTLRKHLVKDIGYDWPWQMRSCFPEDVFAITAVRGTNLPGVWRVPLLHGLEARAGRAPLNYLSGRLMIQARRR